MLEADSFKLMRSGVCLRLRTRDVPKPDTAEAGPCFIAHALVMDFCHSVMMNARRAVSQNQVGYRLEVTSMMIDNADDDDDKEEDDGDDDDDHES